MNPRKRYVAADKLCLKSDRLQKAMSVRLTSDSWYIWYMEGGVSFAYSSHASEQQRKAAKTMCRRGARSCAFKWIHVKDGSFEVRWATKDKPQRIIKVRHVLHERRSFLSLFSTRGSAVLYMGFPFVDKIWISSEKKINIRSGAVWQSTIVCAVSDCKKWLVLYTTFVTIRTECCGATISRSPIFAEVAAQPRIFLCWCESG